MSETTIRACLGNYGAYNAGYLLDEWVDLPMRPQALDETMERMQERAEKLTGSPCEEFYISDYDGRPFDSDVFDMYAMPHELNVLAAMLSTKTEDEIDAVGNYIACCNDPSMRMSELMNCVAQSEDIPMYGYSWEPYTGSDDVYRLMSETRSPEYKYACTVLENNGIYELAEQNMIVKAMEDCLDYDHFGRYCADQDNVMLFDDGYMDLSPDATLDLKAISMKDIVKGMLADLDPDMSAAFASYYKTEEEPMLFPHPSMLERRNGKTWSYESAPDEGHPLGVRIEHDETIDGFAWRAIYAGDMANGIAENFETAYEAAYEAAGGIGADIGGIANPRGTQTGKAALSIREVKADGITPPAPKRTAASAAPEAAKANLDLLKAEGVR